MRHNHAPKTADQLASSYRLDDLGLFNPAPETDYDAITSLASNLFDVPVALISVIDDQNHRQFFKSQLGLAEPWASQRHTPLSHSFCQYVRKFGKPLAVKDARTHELVRDNLAIPDLGVVSYLGAPIYSPSCVPIGALCVIDSKPREWTSKDVELLEKLARCVSNEVRHKATTLSAEKLFEELNERHVAAMHYHSLREWVCGAFMAPNLSTRERFETLLKTGCNALGTEQAVITKSKFDSLDVVYSHNLQHDPELRNNTVSQTLSSYLISGRSQYHFYDTSAANQVGLPDFQGQYPEAFIGVPLLFNGSIYGTLEFSSTKARVEDWTEEDFSMLGVLAMMSGVYLSFVDKIRLLERSEMASLNHVKEHQTKSSAMA